MKGEYAVVWREADGPRFVGRLNVESAGLRLRGSARDGQRFDRTLSPTDVTSVRVVRPDPGDEDASRSVALEQSDGSILTLQAVDGVGALLELAGVAAELSGRVGKTSETVAVEIPTRRGQRTRVRELVQMGPPFDPAAVEGLRSHDVYLGRDRVIFIFRGVQVRNALDQVMHQPSTWRAAADWKQVVAGRPHVLEEGYSWRREEGS
jgi:hypothetical protein